MTMLARMPYRINESWRMDGCGPRCQTVMVTFSGRHYPERLALHDPLHHEAHGEQAAVDGRVLPRGITRTGDLLIDTERAMVAVADREIAVGRIELGVLAYLAAHLGQVCTQNDILRAVWGSDYASGPSLLVGGKARTAEIEHHLLRAVLFRLRAKLGKAGRLIETRRGAGYVLLEEPAA